MRKKIELPEELALGCNGTLKNDKSKEDDFDNELWQAIGVLEEAIDRKGREVKPSLERFQFTDPQDLTENYLKKYPSEPIESYGRTNIYDDALAIKMQKPEEDPSCLKMEVKMQARLAQEEGLKSVFPTPVGVGIDQASQRHYAAFKVPEGYYHYLSDIKDEVQFIKAACTSAHDLGYLLKKGYVFQNLISVFHAEDRPYTLFPSLTQVAAVRYGGFPGKIEDIVGQELYENLGASGLRDVGDMEFIDDFRFCNSNQEQVDATYALKTAHFVSLYLLVFTLILGGRSRKLENNNGDSDPWSENANRYSKILKALFEGMDLQPPQELWHYMDCAIDRDDRSKMKMQPAQKFNEQLRIWFTTKECINDRPVPGQSFRYESSDREKAEWVERRALERQLQERVYGNGRVVYGEFRFNIDRQFMYGSYANRARLWRIYPGCLGQSSGINPLVTAVKYIFRATQLAIDPDLKTVQKSEKVLELESEESAPVRFTDSPEYTEKTDHNFSSSKSCFFMTPRHLLGGLALGAGLVTGLFIAFSSVLSLNPVTITAIVLLTLLAGIAYADCCRPSGPQL